MKKVWSAVLALLVFVMAFSVTSFAADDTQSFYYELTVDGQTQKEVHTGDIITVVLHLYRTDADEEYKMYAMQDEIHYDSAFFELVEGSEILADHVQSLDLLKRDGFREFYMNFLSFGDGEIWKPKTMVGSFQLRVIGTSGVTKITHEDYLVSRRDGSDVYPCEANTLTVFISTDCTVRFASSGGTKVSDITAVYGETIAKPADPTRDGKIFVGWFKDIDCTQPWNFDTDTVLGNMTLYAKWADAPADDTTAPTNDTTAPADDTTVPTDDTTAPTDDTTVPTDDTTVPTDDTTAPTDDTTAPADDTTAPADDTAAPADDTTAPADDTTAPADDTTAPADDTMDDGSFNYLWLLLLVIPVLLVILIPAGKRKKNEQ